MVGEILSSPLAGFLDKVFELSVSLVQYVNGIRNNFETCKSSFWKSIFVPKGGYVRDTWLIEQR
jgi:hypothetical protein